jgi:hypothetical protein
MDEEREFPSVQVRSKLVKFRRLRTSARAPGTGTANQIEAPSRPGQKIVPISSLIYF